MKNIFWVVYDKKGMVISLSKNKQSAKEEALRKSKYRWTIQTLGSDWKYLKNDGVKILRSVITPVVNK